MSDPETVFYIDRRDMQTKPERVHSRDFLHWAYHARLGTLATAYVFSRRPFSRFYSSLKTGCWSLAEAALFAERIGADLSDLARPLGAYGSFSEFFSREIDLARRPLDPDPGSCLAPCDGKILVREKLEPGDSFPVKRNIFSLDSFLGGAAQAARFEGGSLLISRLALGDYHHFHFPCQGTPSPSLSIPGRLHASGPYGRMAMPAALGCNFRMLTPIETERFGLVVMAEVGAMSVGSIRQEYQAGVAAVRGAKKGCFELGGSTVVLVFEPGRIVFDEDLVRNSARGLETYVRMGERVGRQP